MISYVEHYRPLYVLIENVTGMLNCRVNGKQDGRRIIHGVEAGIVKFVMRSLTSLGYAEQASLCEPSLTYCFSSSYQVQINVLNAAEYGSPQARKRVIFWGARLGIPLPKFPTPSHLCAECDRGITMRNVSSIGQIPVASRSRDPDRRDMHDYAPFWAFTVRDAIHDLVSD